MQQRDIDLVAIADALNRHSVKYVLVGDLAAFLYGSKITTSHVEVAICPSH
jgi:hypothetical protein